MNNQKEKIISALSGMIHKKFGRMPLEITELSAGASERKIFRIFTGENSFIGIFNENVKENIAFINFTNAFLKTGLKVPAIIDVSEDNLFYIEEDLGDTTLFKKTFNQRSKVNLDYYETALSDLVRFQIEAKDAIDYGYCYQTREFNLGQIKADFYKFNDYYLNFFLKENPDSRHLDKIFKAIEDVISNVKNDFFLYRDFQPRNIMIKNGELYYIDYQSGRKGPLQYDAASFLYSGSIVLNEGERNSLLNFYISQVNRLISIDEKKFKDSFYFFAFIRLIQMLGNYAYLNVTRNDEKILKKIPAALNNLKDIEKKIFKKEIKDFILNIT